MSSRCTTMRSTRFEAVRLVDSCNLWRNRVPPERDNADLSGSGSSPLRWEEEADVCYVQSTSASAVKAAWKPGLIVEFHEGFALRRVQDFVALRATSLRITGMRRSA
jgi:hypothetical protein